MQMNKQGTLSCRNILLLHKSTKVAVIEGRWLLNKLPECLSPKTQMTASRLVHTLLIYPHTLYISIMFMTSLNDVTIICFPLLVGKGLHMCRRAMPVCLCTHHHPHQLFSTAMHEPSHQFCILNFEPVTYIWWVPCYCCRKLGFSLYSGSSHNKSIGYSLYSFNISLSWLCGVSYALCLPA